MKQKTCKSCNLLFFPNSGRQDYCTQQCKGSFLAAAPALSRVLICKCCCTEFVATGSTSKFCSVKCRQTISPKAVKRCTGCDMDITDIQLTKQYCTQACKVKHRSILKYSGTTGTDYLICPICEIRTRQFTSNHAKMHGYNSIKEMAVAHNIMQVTCSNKKERHTGENNPAYQHNGKFSAWSRNFVNGYCEQRHAKKNIDQSIFVKAHPEKFKNNLAYWLVVADGNAAEAKILHKKNQTRDLAYFVDKYGEQDGTYRHTEKIRKWANSFQKVNFSKISQELFNEIISRLADTTQIYYATHDRPDMVKYKNKEYILSVEHSYVRPDFICLNRKQIIEFDGNYWHNSAAHANPIREKARDEKIKNKGYEILHIAEFAYKQNKDQVIQQCIHFLTK